MGGTVRAGDYIFFCGKGNENPTDATVCRYLFNAKLVLQSIIISILLHLSDFYSH